MIDENYNFLRTKGINNENYKILTTNHTNNLWFVALMTPYLIQVCFYFKNRGFLLPIVQLLLFILELHQLQLRTE